MEPAFDIAIIGGGPAAASVALHLLKLNRSLRLAIFESSDYTNVRAGETLSPPLSGMLKELGLWEAFLQLNFTEAFGTRSSWGGKTTGNDFLFSMHGTGWHVNRNVFDKFLAGYAVKAGVQLYTESKFVFASKNKNWQLQFQHKETGEFAVNSKWVVDATGRKASFARQAGASVIKLDQLCGATRWYSITNSSAPQDSFTHIEAAENGWWYSTLVPEEKMLVTFISDADIIKTTTADKLTGWEKQLQKTKETSALISANKAEEELYVFPALTQYSSRIYGEDWLSVGDACYTMDPLSGQGILKAMRSGAFAAFAIHDFMQGKEDALRKYEQITLAERSVYLNQKVDFYQEGNTWKDALFWERRGALISLAPATVLQFNHSDFFIPGNSLLTREESRKLIKPADRETCTAAELVQQLKAGTGISDKRAILAIQALVNHKVLSPQAALGTIPDAIPTPTEI